MKRILGTVAALVGVLAFGTSSHAALITYNLAGTSSVSTVSQFAPNPPGYVTTPFAAGSYVTINDDANGDTVTGDISLFSGVLNIIGSTSLGALGNIDTDVQVTLYGSVTGSLSGNQILWTDPVSTNTTGTFSCGGAICGIVGLTPGAPYPIAALALITGTQAVNPFAMGTWDMGASLASIVSSTNAVIALGGPTPPPGPGLPAQWYNFAGTAVPEPGVLALALLGFGALALRRRA